MDVVWLKKDVRLADHGPLASVLSPAAPPSPIAAPKFVLLYLYEPSQLRHPTAHGSHVAFANEGLADLQSELQQLWRGDGAEEAAKPPSRCATRADPVAEEPPEQPEQPILTTCVAEAVDALEQLHQSRHGPIARLLSHEETGHLASYARDKAVKRWCCC